MNKFYRHALTAFTLLLTHQGFTQSLSPVNDSPGQRQAFYSGSLYNQSPPNMEDENAFLNAARSRVNEMDQSNQNMINRDRSMIKEGYDPNENFFGGESSNIQGTSSSYPSQEELMRGQSSGMIPSMKTNLSPANVYQGGFSQESKPQNK